MKRVVLAIVVALVAIPAMVLVTGAQSVPALFVGTVRDSNGQPLANALVLAQVSGQVCSEKTSQADGQYSLAIPDNLSRPALCAAAAASVTIYVNGSQVTTTSLGVPGAPTVLDLRLGQAPPPTPTPAAVTVAFNGTAAAGVNSAAIISGGTTAARVQVAAESSSGRKVTAMWIFTGGLWKVYVPNLLAQFETVPGPAASLYIVLS